MRIFEGLRRFQQSEDGKALAELAIMMPFLAIMVAGVAEFGRYFQTYNTLSKAIRDASRYLSNHPFQADPTYLNRAKNLVVCGKLTCAGGDELVPGMTPAHVCIETTGTPNPVTVTVSIPRTASGCGNPYTFQPIFNIGALMGSPTFSLAQPINPSTTMYYLLDN